MTKQQYHHQPDERITLPGIDSDDTSIEGLSTEDLDIEREKLDRAWAEFSRVRTAVAQVMSDDELRALGINVEALDERP